MNFCEIIFHSLLLMVALLSRFLSIFPLGDFGMFSTNSIPPLNCLYADRWSENSTMTITEKTIYLGMKRVLTLADPGGPGPPRPP